MRQFYIAVSAASSALLAVAACRTIPTPREVPAVITHPTPESRAALAAAVSQALNGTPVTLADDALSKTDALIIDREHPRDGSGRQLNGRERGLAEQFQLVKAGDQCSLVHLRTQRHFTLAGVACSAR